MNIPQMKTALGQMLIDLLPATTLDRTWSVDWYGRLRTDINECPACAVINMIQGRIVSYGMPISASKEIAHTHALTLEEEEDISEIMRAADDFVISNSDIRNYMLSVLSPETKHV